MLLSVYTVQLLYILKHVVHFWSFCMYKRRSTKISNNIN